jgi:hypothetical protein
MLSAATRISSDTWFLSPGSADRLEIALPEWSTSVFEITFVLRHTDGLIAAQTKAWIAVPPPAGRLPADPNIGQTAGRQLFEQFRKWTRRADDAYGQLSDPPATRQRPAEPAELLRQPRGKR